MSVPVTIVGNLTADVELKFTPQGKAVAKFSVATSERFKNEKNECMKMRGCKSFDALGAVVKRGRDDMYEQLVIGGSMLACTYL